MKSFYINRDEIFGPWGGGAHFINAFHKYIPTNTDCVITKSPVDANIIFLVSIDHNGYDSIGLGEARAIKGVFPDKKIILRVNENDARKGTKNLDALLIEASKHIDGTVFVSEWLRDYFIVGRKWHCQNNVVIKNGVDRSVFSPGEKISNGKVNIVTAHWSDNYMKGQDFVEFVDEFVGRNLDEFTYTFIGRTQAALRNSILIEPLHGKSLGMELAKYDVCINASRNDPGPNSVIEPISCGVPTYVHSEGGGGVEFAGIDHTFSSFSDVETLLLKKNYQQNHTQFGEWRGVISECVTYATRI